MGTFWQVRISLKVLVIFGGWVFIMMGGGCSLVVRKCDFLVTIPAAVWGFGAGIMEIFFIV